MANTNQHHLRTIPIGDKSQITLCDNQCPDHGLATIPNQSVNLTFTSPPYWNYQQYSDSGLGNETSYDEYMDNLQSTIALVSAWNAIVQCYPSYRP